MRAGNWSLIAKTLNDTMGKQRIGKQCRERWSHHLHPDLRKDAWTAEEEAALVRAHRARGNRWSAIARGIPGRSENAVGFAIVPLCLAYTCIKCPN
jgi:hypothetical protein